MATLEVKVKFKLTIWYYLCISLCKLGIKKVSLFINKDIVKIFMNGKLSSSIKFKEIFDQYEPGIIQ